MKKKKKKIMIIMEININCLEKVKKKYKRLKMETVKPNYQWQMDLADFKYSQKYNSSIRYLLVIIDVYSRYVWVKNKDSNTVLCKFEEIIEEEKVLPE